MVADEAADAGIKGLVQIRVEGGAPQASKAVTEGLSSQQIDDILKLCEAREVGPSMWARPFDKPTCLAPSFCWWRITSQTGMLQIASCRRCCQALAIVS